MVVEKFIKFIFLKLKFKFGILLIEGQSSKRGKMNSCLHANDKLCCTLIAKILFGALIQE